MLAAAAAAANYSVMTRDAIETCRRLPISIITVASLGGASQGEALVVTWAPKRKRAGPGWGSFHAKQSLSQTLKQNDRNGAVTCFLWQVWQNSINLKVSALQV